MHLKHTKNTNPKNLPLNTIWLSCQEMERAYSYNTVAHGASERNFKK